MANAEEIDQMKREFGRQLRQARTQGGLTGWDLATQVGLSQSQVSKIESGLGNTSIDLAQTLADATSMDSATKDYFVRIAKTLAKIRSGVVGAWPRLEGVQYEYLERENAASLIQTFCISGIPALLQTERYATERAAGLTQISSTVVLDTERLILDRMRRQSLLYDNRKQFEFYFWTHSVQYMPCHLDHADREFQIRSMLDSGQRGNIKMRIVPTPRMADLTFTYGDWTLIDNETILVDNAYPTQSANPQAAVDLHHDLLVKLAEVAMSHEDSLTYLMSFIARETVVELRAATALD